MSLGPIINRETEGHINQVLHFFPGLKAPLCDPQREEGAAEDTPSGARQGARMEGLGTDFLLQQQCRHASSFPTPLPASVFVLQNKGINYGAN